MRIPNFNTDEGASLYSNTIGTRISPRVADEVMHMIDQMMTDDVQTILDAGCGPGTVSLYLASKYASRQVHGVDASAAMIAQCKDKANHLGLKNATFEPMKVDNLDFGEQKFDFVISNLAFPFFTDPIGSMQQIFNALRPNGITCFSVLGRDTWKEFFEIAEETLGDMIRMARPFLVKFSQAEQLPSAMELAGFQNIELHNKFIPFEFKTGADVLAFFSELFSLLSYSPPAFRADLMNAIDEKYPNGGFTMHYNAVIAFAKKPSV